MIPVAMAELDEADSRAPRGGARGGSCWRSWVWPGVGAVEVEHFLRLLREVGQLGHAGLHAEGEFVVLDLRADGGVAEVGEGDAVQLVGGVDELAAGGGADAGWVGDVEDGVARVAELDAGVLRGQEAASPVARLQGLPAAAAGEDDEGGQVAVGAAEPVGEPGADAGTCPG